MNLIVAALLSCAQQQPAPPKVDQRKVDEAIRKGVEYLKGVKERTGPGSKRGAELTLWTFVHAGVPENDAKFQDLLKGMLDEEPMGTYRTALRAMILEELERVKYQEEIWKCAQYLVDNQSPQGYWSYGKPTTYPPLPPPVPTGKKDVATSSRKAPARGAVEFAPGGLLPPGARVKPPVKQYLEVKKQRDGGNTDNSNSQYAALGLRACHDAGILLPKEVLEKAEKRWRNCQEGEGPKAKSDGVATAGGSGRPEGWDYQNGKQAYGSMTAGGLGSLVIYLHLQGKPLMADPDVLSGLAWMAEHFTVTENPGAKPQWHYYFLYGMERAGVLYGTEWMGKHPWYFEGAQHLLGAQKPDGSWGATAPSTPEWDTCFAILFLRRATRPLTDVASVDPLLRKK